MAGLIIGHTDHQSVKIWVQGQRSFSRVRVGLRPAGKASGDDKPDLKWTRLEANSDFTKVVDFGCLKAGSDYSIKAEFRSPLWLGRRQVLHGKFRTFPTPGSSDDRFAFVLGSCNLSTVKINNLLGLVSGVLGQRAASRALLHKPRGRFKWIRIQWRRVLNLFSKLITGLVQVDTGFRQTGAPLLSSAFLRLSELFDNTPVHFNGGINEPGSGSCICVRRNDASVARGTYLGSSLLGGEWETRSAPPPLGFAKLAGIEGRFEPGESLEFHAPENLALKAPDRKEGSLGICRRVTAFGVHFEGGEYKPPLGSRICGKRTDAGGVLIDLKLKHGHWKSDQPRACGTLLLTGLEGSFKSGDEIIIDDPEHLGAARFVGIVAAIPPARPAFMIHAGDQIYFDFPSAYQRPSLEEYRRCYRQSWFEDDWTQSILNRCPHYMTLDDHEIVDNYARDFEPRQPKSGFGPPGIRKKIKSLFEVAEARRTPESYSIPALRAYREYVNERHPGTAEGKYYYEFRHGNTPFFVLDTRTERYLRAGPVNANPDRPQMISDGQLKAFKDWLLEHRDTLKFVVSSVPFVAQVRATSDEGRTYRGVQSNQPSLDKWSGAVFERQRGEIIDFVNEKRIQNLVVLAGDVHCCYHATMRVGLPDVTTVIHELAGGPIYQLRTGRQEDFFSVYEGKTEEGCNYRSQMEQIYGGASAAVSIRVKRKGSISEVDWEVVRTMPEPKGARTNSLPRLSVPATAGCIIFDGDHANYGKV